MPKLKTHSGTKKRFKVSAKGKVMARKTHRMHNFSSKSAGRNRRLKKGLVLSPAEAANIRAVIHS